MIKKTLTILLLITATRLSAMEDFIQLPSKQKISNRLNSLGLNDFVSITNIDQTLSLETKHIVGIIVVVDSALDNYKKFCRNKEMTKKAERRRTDIIKTILDNNPKSIEKLKQFGLLK